MSETIQAAVTAYGTAGLLFGLLLAIVLTLYKSLLAPHERLRDHLKDRR